MRSRFPARRIVPSSTNVAPSCCPTCGASLSLNGAEATCASGHSFPVADGIPRLVDAARLGPGQDTTAEAFGYSWTHHPLDNPYTEEQWRDWVEPLKPADFAGKRVLDAGCGLGGFVEYSRRWGAGRIVGVDLSEGMLAKCSLKIRRFSHAPRSSSRLGVKPAPIRASDS